MIGTDNKKVLPSQFMLTPEQRIALLEAKVARAEQYAKALAEVAKKFRKD
jgi:hypothetical protein